MKVPGSPDDVISRYSEGDFSPISAENEEKIRIVCGTCGSEDVRRDADATWNVKSQKWELNAVYDQGYCEICRIEVRLKEIPAE